jgi:threonine-phosphate decarboxylase
MGLIRIKTEYENNTGCGVGPTGFEMEEHGGNIYKIAEELGVAEAKLVDFSASINPMGISGKVKGVIEQCLDNMVNYPDPDTKTLRNKIAGYHNNINSGSIICGNGSTELVYLIPRALRPGSVLVTSPSFSEYERACKIINGLRIVRYELRREDNFKINPRKFIGAMRGCDMAFLCNPNNPTGLLLSRDNVLEIAEAAEKGKCLLVVDEAFIDFCPGATVVNNVSESPYLAVLRSMTKIYALAGLRIGYGVFHNDLIERIKKFKEPWTVNSLAQRAAIAAIEDISYKDETLKLMKEEKDFLEKGFRQTGIGFSPSAANYYLLKTDNAGTVVRKLRDKGILVRDCSNFKGLDGSYIRVAVKTRKHNKILLKELAKLCAA